MKKVKKTGDEFEKNRKPKNTSLDQKASQKSSKNPIFIVRKWSPPKKVDKLITLKVDKLITLWRPKGGQTNNSPAYIYIYVVELKLVQLYAFL